MLHLLELYYPLLFVWLSGITALFVYKKLETPVMRLLAVSIMLIALIDTAGTVLAGFHKGNHFLYNILYAINFLILGLFFSKVLRSLFMKRLAYIFLISFSLFHIINTVFIQGFEKLNTYSYVFGGSFVLVFSIAYIWQLYMSDETKSIWRDPAFWFSVAWLIYFAVSVPYFGMLNFLWEQYPDFTSFYFSVIYFAAAIIYNLLITTGLLCRRISAK